MSSLYNNMHKRGGGGMATRDVISVAFKEMCAKNICARYCFSLYFTL